MKLIRRLNFLVCFLAKYPKSKYGKLWNLTKQLLFLSKYKKFEHIFEVGIEILNMYKTGSNNRIIRLYLKKLRKLLFQWGVGTLY